MQLDKNYLMGKKTISQLVDLCVKLNSDNEDLRVKIAKLQKEKASEEVKKTNSELRKKVKELQAKLDRIKADIG